METGGDGRAKVRLDASARSHWTSLAPIAASCRLSAGDLKLDPLESDAEELQSSDSGSESKHGPAARAVSKVDARP